MADTALRLLIVIPCLNEERHLARVIDGLLRNCAELDARIAIVDGGSADRTREIAAALSERNPSVVLLHNPKKLQSAAINLAAATFGGEAEFLLRVDAHADYPPGFCRVLLAEAGRTGAASVVIPMDTVGTGSFQRAVAAAQNSKLGNGGSAHRSSGGEGRWVEHGHHALMRLSAFREAGGYDESFSHNEDAELDLRLHRKGHRIWLTGATHMTYYPRSAPLPLLLQYFRFGRGRARTTLKHRILPRLRQLLPIGIAPALLLAVLAPLSGLAVVPALCWAGICLGYGARLGLQAKDPAVALGSGFAAMLMHAGWSFGFWYGLGRGMG